ncbi:MAG: biotin transporter BioY [Pseudomonadota bacterium]
MANTPTHSVLTEALWPAEGASLWLRRAALVILGIAALGVAAKIKVPFWPVPITMQTFVVLSVGAAYGLRLGAATMLGYLLIGALGFDVFTSSSADLSGLTYMAGPTGGYLLGFLLATMALGALARRGWDRSPARMACAMIIGLVLVYVPGVLWLGHLLASHYSWGWVLEWGWLVFMPAEALKLALAALVFPALWRLAAPMRG